MMSIDEVAAIFHRNMTALVTDAGARRRRREERLDDRETPGPIRRKA